MKITLEFDGPSRKAFAKLLNKAFEAERRMDTVVRAVEEDNGMWVARQTLRALDVCLNVGEQDAVIDKVHEFGGS